MFSVAYESVANGTKCLVIEMASLYSFDATVAYGGEPHCPSDNFSHKQLPLLSF